MVELVELLPYGIELLVFAVITCYFILRSRSTEWCQNLQLNPDILNLWRVLLYTAAISGLLTTYFTFVRPENWVWILHLIFVVATSIDLTISLPTWLCKRRGTIDACYCSIYQYNDFRPIIFQALIGSATLVFGGLGGNIATYFLLFIIGLIVYTAVTSKARHQHN